MTTVNNAKAPKVTLNSIVFSAAPVLRELNEGETHTKAEIKEHAAAMAEHIRSTSIALATYLVNKTENVDLIAKLFSETAAVLPTVLSEVLKQREDEEKAKAEEKRKADEAKRLQLEQEQKELEQKKEKMLKVLLDNGVDLEVAKAMLDAGAKKLSPNSGKSTYDRVSCTIEGNKYDIPVRGNMSQVLKDLAAKYGFADDREAFIEKFRDTPATAEENKEQAEA